MSKEKLSVIDGPGSHMIELALNRREPEDYRDRPVSASVQGMLSGLLVRVDRSRDAEVAEADAATLTVRRAHNTHGCRQFGPPGRADGGCGTCETCVGYEVCRHPAHARDIAMMRTVLRKIFQDPPDVRYLAARWEA